MPKSDFMLPKETKKTKVAKELAKAYLRRLKYENIFGKPWNMSLPVEVQSVFPHFVKAAEIVIEEEADPKIFIASQFDGLKWAKKIPFPQQLSTPNARLRYLDHNFRLSSKKDKVVREDDFLIDDFVLEQKKLDKLAKSTGVSQRKALKMFRSEFTKSFRQLHKVK